MFNSLHQYMCINLTIEEECLHGAEIRRVLQEFENEHAGLVKVKDVREQNGFKVFNIGTVPNLFDAHMQKLDKDIKEICKND